VQFDHVGVSAASKRDAMRHRVVADPSDVFDEVRVAFVEVDGAPVEFVQPFA
jgi:hypothetical protein